ncbi:glycosyltransferase family 2 protein [Coprobacter sp.]
MKYNIDDIDIYVMTHNRAGYVKQSIDSLLNQSAGIRKITVLDNESTDETKSVVESFSSRGIKYIKTEGFLGNFRKAQELASRKYVMLFHDDDILHPKYLEMALQVLNEKENISLITTRYTEFFDDNLPPIPDEVSSDYYFFKKQKDFATHMYFLERIAYATALYRTSDFRKTPIEYEKFNKFNDWPFMVKISRYGNTVLFNDPSLFYIRRHKGQDTWTSTNTPSLQQIINWDKFFYNKVGAWNLFSKVHYVFACWFTHFLFGKYDAFLSPQDKESCSKVELLRMAKKSGIKTWGSSVYCKYRCHNKNACKRQGFIRRLALKGKIRTT